MFSATFPPCVQSLAHDFLHPRFAFVSCGVVGGANRDISQHLIDVTKKPIDDPGAWFPSWQSWIFFIEFVSVLIEHFIQLWSDNIL